MKVYKLWNVLVAFSFINFSSILAYYFSKIDYFSFSFFFPHIANDSPSLQRTEVSAHEGWIDSWTKNDCQNIQVHLLYLLKFPLTHGQDHLQTINKIQEGSM